jgi:phosphate-selective porin OprO/OprP
VDPLLFGGALVVGLPIQLQAAQDPAPSQDVRPTPMPDAQVKLQAGYDEHFFVQDESGRNRVELGALLQVHGSFFERGVGRESDVFLRRFRLEIGGQVEDFWKFNMEPKFTADDVELEEAWVGFELGPDRRVMIGRMKEPFSLEEIIPLKHIATVNLSILNQFIPAEGHGVTLYAQELEKRVDWGLAGYRGGADGLNGGSEAAGRLVLRPWAQSENFWIRGLQAGAAATYGRAHEVLAGDELRMEAREPFATFESGAALDGDRSRLGAEAAWLVGPVQLLAEAMRIGYDLEGSAGSERATADGFYVGAAWVLSGEERTFKGVRPSRPFLPRDSLGLGAVELAARVSRLRLSDDFVESGALAALSDPERVDSLDVGINWYATWRARIKLHGLFTRYGEPMDVGGGPIRREQALLVQFQLIF